MGYILFIYCWTWTNKRKHSILPKP